MKTRQLHISGLSLLLWFSLLTTALTTGCGKASVSIAGTYKEHRNETGNEYDIWEFTDEGRVTVWSLPKGSKPDFEGKFRTDGKTVLCRWEGSKEDLMLTLDGDHLRVGKFAVLTKLNAGELSVAARSDPRAEQLEIMEIQAKTRALKIQTLTDQFVLESYRSETVAASREDSHQTNAFAETRQMIVEGLADAQVEHASDLEMSIHALSFFNALKNRRELMESVFKAKGSDRRFREISSGMSRLEDDSFGDYEKFFIRALNKSPKNVDFPSSMASSGKIVVKEGTPLMLAALNGRLEFAKTLLHLGATVEATDAYGSTALMLAEKSGQTEIVALLKAAAK